MNQGMYLRLLKKNVLWDGGWILNISIDGVMNVLHQQFWMDYRDPNINSSHRMVQPPF